MRNKTFFFLLLAVALLSGLSTLSAHPNQQQDDPKEGWDIPKHVSQKKVIRDDGKPVIQIALLLDTSGSMSGLIEQAKTELWSIVNSLGEARYKGQVPTIEVALFEYGKSTLSANQGYIRQLNPLSTDLDGLSETLFSLQTNGGQEYCAWVIRTAMQTLQWKKRKGSLRLVFIAGNESFYQGPVDFDSVMSEAEKDGLFIHPIYCDNGNANDKLTWRQAAQLAKTDLKVIDHNQVVVDPPTPYDDRIQALGTEINSTYVAYGESKKRAAVTTRQAKQDVNSEAAGAAVNRSITKGSSNYNNAGWDVVDAEKAGELSVEELDEDELPKEMQGMSKSERRAYVDKKAAERKAIQKELNELRQKRDAYLAKNRKDNAQPASLGRAVVKAVKSQTQDTGFTID